MSGYWSGRCFLDCLRCFAHLPSLCILEGGSAAYSCPFKRILGQTLHIPERV